MHQPGTDSGVSQVNSPDSPIDDYLNFVTGLYGTAVAWNQGDPNVRVLEYMRYPRYTSTYRGWTHIIPDPDPAWIAYAEANGPTRVVSYVGPVAGLSIDVDHFAAVANGVTVHGQGTGITTNVGDFSGWGGDLTTFYAEWGRDSDTTASGYTYCMDRLAKIDTVSTFEMSDLIADVDGYLVGMNIHGRSETIVDAVQNLLQGGGALSRFKRFYDARYNGDNTNAFDTTKDMLTDGTDPDVSELRIAAIQKTAGSLTLMPVMLPDDVLNPARPWWLIGAASRRHVRRPQFLSVLTAIRVRLQPTTFGV
ncbi:hypothetical protein [Actinacidiphila oryziradicis]|uniref:Uncharacterized protein n=1 Tax=Actinacidiphila oryziradicis TaxID=2571141 RepID=A0A4U0RG10_9ACTN|nr:hypothetical protein [Actinacidiphila oryziradicis]TJZ94461.1 hypothetical protein FCI23_53650 [Actinacidiphila oryziradicis]